VKRRLETLVTLDELVQVGLVHGTHTDGETHCIYFTHFKSLINSLRSR
jgi:hypothetical protein